MIGQRERVQCQEFQMDFRKGRRTTDNIFILRTIVDKYLARKRGKIYWIFVDLQKAFGTVLREALWWKLSKKGILTKCIEGIKAIYRNAKITIPFEGSGVSEEFDSNIGLRQGCALSLTLFNVFIDGIISRLEEANTHPFVINQRQVVGLLFADNLSVGATTRIGLQRAINCVKDFYEEWGLKINVPKTMVFKKGRKLSRDDKWWLDGKEIEIVKEIKYLGVMLDSRRKLNKDRKQVLIRGKISLSSIYV
jgi:hypothetical protein